MKPIALYALALSLCSFGCARAALVPNTSAHASSPSAPHASEQAEGDADDSSATSSATDDAKDEAPSIAARRAGDFVVYRFSGAFRKAPATLTERVFAREGDELVVDVTLDDGGAKRSLRVRMSDEAATRGEVTSVAKLDHGKETKATLADYEALLASTTLAADANEASLGSETVEIDVAHEPVPATKTSYRVRVGASEATLSTLESAAFAWGDLGGEIRDASGKVLYRAEVFDAGHAADALPRAAAVAHSDLDD